MAEPDRTDATVTPLILFEVEAIWRADENTSIVRYIEATDLRTALSVVPEESEILSIRLLGGLYRTARTKEPSNA